jgi:hypothetical protein
MDAIIRDFSLALAAEGKKPKTIKIYTDAASWLQRTQELDDWSTVKKSTSAGTSRSSSKTTLPPTPTTSTERYSSRA